MPKHLQAGATAGGDLTGTYPNPTIATNAVTNAKAAQMAANSFKGNNTGSTANAADLTVAQAKTLLAIVPGDVTGFDTQVRTSRLDQMAAPTSDISINSHKLTSVTDPTAAQDAATKAYVDAVAQGLSVKGSVRLATAAALPTNTYLTGVITITATGVLTVDGSTVALNDRILVKDEVSQLKNGVYVCTTAGAIGVAAVLTRSADMDASAEFPGAFVFSETGTANAAAGFVCTNSTPPTVGTTAITFTQFSGAGEITAGNGLSKSGNSLSIDTSITADKSTAQAFTNKDLTGAGNTFPTFNQNTTGSAAKLTTARNIDGQAFDGSADVTVIAPGTHAATGKTTPVDADELPLVDSAASNVLKKLTWANLKATIKSYYDSVSSSLTNKDLTGAGNTFPTFNQNTTGSAGSVLLPGSLAAGASQGMVLTLTSAQTQAIGDLVTINSAGNATLAKADAIANASAVLIATAAVSGSASNTYMPLGILRLSSSPTWTKGGLIYLSTTGTTGNTLTQTAPSGANNVIQVIGIALGVDIILFNPSLVQVEHV